MSLPLSEITAKRPTKVGSDSYYSVLDDPAYREKYRERLTEARKKGMDIVIYCDGTIVFIENKISMYPYKWHKKRRDFERTKLSNRNLRGSRRSGAHGQEDSQNPEAAHSIPSSGAPQYNSEEFVD